MRFLAVIVTSLLLVLAGAPVVLAADAADRAIIGFSGDGRFFAFEEFGIQDGSGFPYANIYVIDLENDRWVEDSPVRVLKREDNGSLYEARRQALNEAAPIIDKYGTIQPARLLASNAVGEEVTDPHTMVFKRFHNVSTLWTVKPVSYTHLTLPTTPYV
jgi:predicted secreted protein